jgi:hypothetical protein
MAAGHVGTLELLLDMVLDAALAANHERILVALGALLVDPESVARLGEQVRAAPVLAGGGWRGRALTARCLARRGPPPRPAGPRRRP